MVVKVKVSKEEILVAWQEAKPVKGKNPDIWRKDEDGNLICFDDYEKSTKFAWQIA